MTLSEVLLLLTLLCSIAYGVFDITWKISHDDKNQKNKKDGPPSTSPSTSVNLFCSCTVRSQPFVRQHPL